MVGLVVWYMVVDIVCVHEIAIGKLACLNIDIKQRTCTYLNDDLINVCIHTVGGTYYAYVVTHAACRLGCMTSNCQGRPLQQRDAHKCLTVGDVVLHAPYTGPSSCNLWRGVQRCTHQGMERAVFPVAGLQDLGSEISLCCLVE